VPFAVLGMYAYLAAVTLAPLTSLVFVTEMTSGHALMFPLMCSARLSSQPFLSCCDPLYRTLAERYLR
jgi:H+/Cl- antiporter ClcA